MTMWVTAALRGGIVSEDGCDEAEDESVKALPLLPPPSDDDGDAEQGAVPAAAEDPVDPVEPVPIAAPVAAGLPRPLAQQLELAGQSPPGMSLQQASAFDKFIN